MQHNKTERKAIKHTPHILKKMLRNY